MLTLQYCLTSICATQWSPGAWHLKRLSSCKGHLCCCLYMWYTHTHTHVSQQDKSRMAYPPKRHWSCVSYGFLLLQIDTLELLSFRNRTWRTWNEHVCGTKPAHWDFVDTLQTLLHVHYMYITSTILSTFSVLQTQKHTIGSLNKVTYKLG